VLFRSKSIQRAGDYLDRLEVQWEFQGETFIRMIEEKIFKKVAPRIRNWKLYTRHTYKADPWFREIVNQVLSETLGASKLKGSLAFSALGRKHSFHGNGIDETVRQLFAKERKELKRCWSTRELPENEDADQERQKPEPLQDSIRVDAQRSEEAFRHVVFCLGQDRYRWTDCKPSAARDIWHDQFKDPDEICGEHRLNWTGEWREYRAFFEASHDILFKTTKSKNEFFAAHFRKDGRTRTGEQVRNGTRGVLKKNRKDASEIVNAVSRMIAEKT
jgi:hypothetical protein